MRGVSHTRTVMSLELDRFVHDFAGALMAADAARPCATNARSKVAFQLGIGPHSEAQTVKLVGTELERLGPPTYGHRLTYGVAYPEVPRQKCDLCVGSAPYWEWAVEIKMLRILGDNGKANDNILMHLLSPYPAHRSALTDCEKLAESRLGRRKAILIFGYDADAWPLEPAISAFETLARARTSLGKRLSAEFRGLVHPVHSSGRVFAWELQPARHDG
jgi:hypothetical protein